jgi:iron transport multicopper oxidase
MVSGNIVDYLNLKGQNNPLGFIPAGFITRSILALVFSCVCVVVGIISIAVHGV